ncbi:redoxin domain-containing protein [Terriglobus sp. TAA 43]|uniref:redoxin domain-containing protein n=1 Tax=Terriglobus sp. TAA 43 TaxID=278961 RepID=UPI00068E8FA1|nr:redoxin domain-containing protein [Terriglobus sp. TAA 43]
MRRNLILIQAALATASSLAFAQTAPAPPAAPGATKTVPMSANLEHPLMPIGTDAPDFALTGTDDKIHTLSEFSKGKVLVVMFESVHCPVSENYEGRMRALYDTYHGKGVEFIAINPNNPKAVRLDELGYTDLTDAPDDMKIRVRDRQIPWPYVSDGQTQTTAQKFGAVATPHVFIFDQDRKLRYEGRIDDNQNQSLVKVHDANDAIEALLSGGTVAVPHRPAFGCSTKWLSKTGDVDREMAKIHAEPVALTPTSAAEMTALRANNTDKVTVVHFWSTTVPNGEKDFAALQTTYRMYRGRAYDFVTVNTDGSAKTTQATDFLHAQYASSRNLQLAATDMKAVSDAFGTTLSANEEFTAVIAPGGKVVYTHKGPLDVLELRHAVLANFTDNPHYPGQAEYWASRTK